MGAWMREDVELGGAVTRVRIRRPLDRGVRRHCARGAAARGARDGGLCATAIRHRIQASERAPAIAADLA
jgi:hypothetical protein